MTTTREWTFHGAHGATKYELAIGELDPGIPKIVGITVLAARLFDGRYVERDEMSDRLSLGLCRAVSGLLSDPDFLRREVLK